MIWWQNASKFSWAYTSLKSKWQEALSIMSLICTANTLHRLLLRSTTIALAATLKLCKGFKYTRTFWSCNLMHMKVLLYVLACISLTRQGTKQTLTSSAAFQWMNVHPRSWPHRRANPLSLTSSASSWKQFHLKSKSSSLSHHIGTVTDANGLEDSFLTASSSSRAVSEWVL